MSEDHWFELRMEGSAGTSTAGVKGAAEGVAIAENGRLCSISSGRARRFKTEQEAMDYLNLAKVTGDYHFEAVLCKP